MWPLPPCTLHAPLLLSLALGPHGEKGYVTFRSLRLFSHQEGAGSSQEELTSMVTSAPDSFTETKPRASPVAQLVNNRPAMQETWVRCLHWEDPLEKGKAPHSSVLAWRTPWNV